LINSAVSAEALQVAPEESVRDMTTFYRIAVRPQPDPRTAKKWGGQMSRWVGCVLLRDSRGASRLNG